MSYTVETYVRHPLDDALQQEEVDNRVSFVLMVPRVEQRGAIIVQILLCVPYAYCLFLLETGKLVVS